MSMRTYKYVGKDRTAACGQLLYSGCEYALNPEDNHVRSLVKKGLLVIVPEQQKPQNKK